MHQENENREIIEKALDRLGLNQSLTRRSFFKLSGITVVGISALVSLGAKSGKEMPLIIMDQAQGNWGNGLIIQDSCKQCPHPVPCANVCPNDAIVVKPPTHARVVDGDKCIGCKMCQRACPWEMMSFDQDENKATKCFLCNGTPKCVEACPAEALQYVAWRDMTNHVPPRVVPTAVIPPEKAAACNECHKK
jgi:Fe-S-cluster-containing hydrogenase component 2